MVADNRGCRGALWFFTFLTSEILVFCLAVVRLWNEIFHFSHISVIFLNQNIECFMCWSFGVVDYCFFFSLYLLYGKKIFVLRICLPHSLLILSKHPLVLFDCSKNITNSKMLFFYINCYNWCKVSLCLGKRGKKIAAGKSKAWSEVGVDKIDLRREAVLSLWHC